jgi:hypothetical protein
MAKHPAGSMRVKSDFQRYFNVIWVVQSSSQKYSTFQTPQISGYWRRPVLTRGRFAIVTNVGAGCDGRDGARDERCLLRTTKSCGPDAPVLASSWRAVSRRRRWQKAGHRGEREVSRKAIAQGEPELVRLNLWSYLPCFLLHRTHGCDRRPALPAPSFEGRLRLCPSEGWKGTQNSGASRRENANAYRVAV